MTTIAEIVEAVDFGQPSARKTGRNPAWPYVPIIIETVPNAGGRTTQRQLLKLAYATREEAVAKAEAHIANQRKVLAQQLAQPQYRALREHYGLPRELEGR